MEPFDLSDGETIKTLWKSVEAWKLDQVGNAVWLGKARPYGTVGGETKHDGNRKGLEGLSEPLAVVRI
jgi:hypothetical protein